MCVVRRPCPSARAVFETSTEQTDTSRCTGKIGSPPLWADHPHNPYKVTQPRHGDNGIATCVAFGASIKTLEQSMDPRGCKTRKSPTSRLAVRWPLAMVIVCALASYSFAQHSVMRRLPTTGGPGAGLSEFPNADPRSRIHDTWNQPGLSWYASWNRFPDSGDSMVHAYEAMFQNPHTEEVPPPPGTVAEQPSGGALAQDETIGEEPEDYNVQFLRRQSVLLGHGDWQMDYGVSYGLSENDFPVAVLDNLGDVTGTIEGTNKNRLLLTPVEFRYGVTERAQAFVNIPMGWSNSELTFTGFDEFESEIGIGDVSGGLSILLCDGCQYKPDVIATLGFTAPTGNPEFPLLTTLTPNSTLGEGYWAASAQLLFIHTYDPVVLFWGFGYRHRFDEDFANTNLGIQQDVRPGRTAFYQCGVGFGVNEWITLSTSFAGAYISEMYIDGDRVEGTILEPLRLRVAVTINSPAKIIEPFAEFGMTDDAVDARFGITWTHTHRRCSGSNY